MSVAEVMQHDTIQVPLHDLPRNLAGVGCTAEHLSWRRLGSNSNMNSCEVRRPKSRPNVLSDGLLSEIRV